MKALLVRQTRFLSTLGLRGYISYRIAPRGMPLDVCVLGRRIWVRARTRDLGVAVSCLGGEFEPLRSLLDRDFDGVIVDAGGYIGTAAIALSELYPHAKIVTIEPSYENIGILKRNAQRYPNITVIHGALSGISGAKLKLKNRETGHWGYSVVEAPGDRPDARVIEEVDSYTLSDLVSDPKMIGIIKLDIEGAEKSLFEGDQQVMRAVPAVFVELHDRIIEGCTSSFREFSKDRWVVKCGGEKYLSLSKESPRALIKPDELQSAA